MLRFESERVIADARLQRLACRHESYSVASELGAVHPQIVSAFGILQRNIQF